MEKSGLTPTGFRIYRSVDNSSQATLAKEDSNNDAAINHGIEQVIENTKATQHAIVILDCRLASLFEVSKPLPSLFSVTKQSLAINFAKPAKSTGLIVGKYLIVYSFDYFAISQNNKYQLIQLTKPEISKSVTKQSVLCYNLLNLFWHTESFCNKVIKTYEPSTMPKSIKLTFTLWVDDTTVVATANQNYPVLVILELAKWDTQKKCNMQNWNLTIYDPQTPRNKNNALLTFLNKCFDHIHIQHVNSELALANLNLEANKTKPHDKIIAYFEQQLVSGYPQASETATNQPYSASSTSCKRKPIELEATTLSQNTLTDADPVQFKEPVPKKIHTENAEDPAINNAQLTKQAQITTANSVAGGSPATSAQFYEKLLSYHLQAPQLAKFNAMQQKKLELSLINVGLKQDQLTTSCQVKLRELAHKLTTLAKFGLSLNEWWQVQDDRSVLVVTAASHGQISYGYAPILVLQPAGLYRILQFKQQQEPKLGQLALICPQTGGLDQVALKQVVHEQLVSHTQDLINQVAPQPQLVFMVAYIDQETTLPAAETYLILYNNKNKKGQIVNLTLNPRTSVTENFLATAVNQNRVKFEYFPRASLPQIPLNPYLDLYVNYQFISKLLTLPTSLETIFEDIVDLSGKADITSILKRTVNLPKNPAKANFVSNQLTYVKLGHDLLLQALTGNHHDFEENLKAEFVKYMNAPETSQLALTTANDNRQNQALITDVLAIMQQIKQSL